MVRLISMADNYLERRMEDLRNGKFASPGSFSPTSSANLSASSGRKGMLTFPFPSKRVLVAGNLDRLQEEIIYSFQRTGCRVACFSDNRETGEKLSHGGVRFHPVDFDETGNIETNFGILMKAWRDLDIMIICLPSCAMALFDLWSKHKQKFPIPSDYGGRIITIGFTIGNLSDNKADILSNLGQYGITCNSILPESHSDENTITMASRTTLFLSLPGNTINYLIIPLPVK